MDYHDYVIKDGQFIGRFEEMYRKCDDPWHMLNPPPIELWSRRITVEMLNRNGISSVIEVGSAFGILTNDVHQAGIRICGIDISETAVNKARSLFPEIEFRVEKAE